ncbi:MAG: hypothetical protein JWL69_1846 [Phycisphaerales bacterium]|nr:hypothetical protein [Phycisphaerales bacterium]
MGGSPMRCHHSDTNTGGPPVPRTQEITAGSAGIAVGFLVPWPAMRLCQVAAATVSSLSVITAMSVAIILIGHGDTFVENAQTFAQVFLFLSVVLAFCWAAVLFMWYVLAMPGKAIRGWRDQARLARGQCLLCGYDLTGNVSGVCPECGRSVE